MILRFLSATTTAIAVTVAVVVKPVEVEVKAVVVFVIDDRDSYRRCFSLTARGVQTNRP